MEIGRYCERSGLIDTALRAAHKMHASPARCMGEKMGPYGQIRVGERRVGPFGHVATIDKDRRHSTPIRQEIVGVTKRISSTLGAARSLPQSAGSNEAKGRVGERTETWRQEQPS